MPARHAREFRAAPRPQAGSGVEHPRRAAPSSGRWPTGLGLKLDAGRSPSDIAFLQYTGGTTGVSKAAMLTHRNMVANVLQATPGCSRREEAAPRDRITALPLYHIFSLTANCLAFLPFGAHNILITNPRDFPASSRS